MLPASNPPLMRQSCDRCHRQKLRCTREGNSNTGACDRCLRKRAQCVYSSSLPKGRPSIYNSSDGSTAAATGAGLPNRSSSGPITPVSPETVEMSHRHRHGSQSEVTVAATVPVVAAAAAANGDVDVDVEADAEAEADVNADANISTDVSADVPANASMNEDSILGPIDAAMDISSGPWPWQSAFIGDDAYMDWGDHGSSQPTFHWRANVPPQNDAPSVYPETLAVPNVMDRVRTGKGTAYGHVRGKPPSPPPAPGGAGLQGLGNVLEKGQATGIGGSLTVDKKKDVDNVIPQLSQLSLRLASLHRSSHALAELAESPRPSREGLQNAHMQLLDDAAFESVASWLAQAARGKSASANPMTPYDTHSHYSRPTTGSKPRGGLLHDVFSASHYILEILRSLQPNVSDDTSGLCTPTFSSSSTSMSTPSAGTSSDNSSYFGRARGASVSTPSPSHRSSDNIIRHLILACHIQLLNIYAALLICLQHDAQQPSAHMDTAALGQIRLVSVVQLCSYLVERQHQAVGIYITYLRSPPYGSSWQDLGQFAHQQGPPPVLAADDEDVMKDLKKEVQQRLARLQQTLCI